MNKDTLNSFKLPTEFNANGNDIGKGNGYGNGNFTSNPTDNNDDDMMIDDVRMSLSETQQTRSDLSSHIDIFNTQTANMYLTSNEYQNEHWCKKYIFCCCFRSYNEYNNAEYGVNKGNGNNSQTNYTSLKEYQKYDKHRKQFIQRFMTSMKRVCFVDVIFIFPLFI